VWLNERVMEAAADTFSTHADIREMQIDAWEEFMAHGESSPLIDAGIARLRRAVRDMYKPGDLITSHPPDDPCSPLVYLLIREDAEDWIALAAGELQRLPLRFWLTEDHTLLGTEHTESDTRHTAHSTRHL